MRSVSILLAVGAGAFAPSTLSRPKTALAVHRPRVAVSGTSNFKHHCGRTRVRMAALRPPHGPALHAAHHRWQRGINRHLTMRGATGRPSRPLEPHTFTISQSRHAIQIKMFTQATPAAKKANRLRPKKKALRGH